MPTQVKKTAGKVFQLARGRWLLATGGSFLLAAAGAAWRLPGPPTPRAVISLLIATMGLCVCLWWVCKPRRRLIVGKERMQLVDGEATVVGQVPYDQVRDVRFTSEEVAWGERVQICLRLIGAPSEELFWPGLLEGAHELLLDARFDSDPADLRRALRSRWQDYRDSLNPTISHGGVERNMDLRG